jgi:short subunit fatty acids transporter
LRAFKFLKQQFHYEELRVRKFTSIQNLNHLLLLIFNFLALMLCKKDRSFANKLIETSNSIKGNVSFEFFQLAKGIKKVLMHSTKDIHKYLDGL